MYFDVKHSLSEPIQEEKYPETYYPYNPENLLQIDLSPFAGTRINANNIEQVFINAVTHNIKNNILQFMNLMNYQVPNNLSKNYQNQELPNKTLVFSKCEINNNTNSIIEAVFFNVTCTEKIEDTNNQVEFQDAELSFDLIADLTNEFEVFSGNKLEKLSETAKNKEYAGNVIEDVIYEREELIGSLNNTINKELTNLKKIIDSTESRSLTIPPPLRISSVPPADAELANLLNSYKQLLIKNKTKSTNFMINDLNMSVLDGNLSNKKISELFGNRTFFKKFLKK